MNITKSKPIVVLALAIAAVAASAQHVKVFDGRTSQSGAHGSGGGAGKVHVHDISLTKSSNVLFAFDPGFRGGVFVGAASMGGAGLDVLIGNTGADRMAKERTLTVSFGKPKGGSVADLVIDPFNSNREFDGAPPMKWDNVKNKPLGVRIGLIRLDGKGKMEEYKTLKLKGAKILQNVNGTLTVTFTGLEVVPPVSAGGTWYVKNPDGPGEPLIGLLLPAVQKVR